MLITLLFSTFSCDSGTDSGGTDFDRSAMLQNYGNNIIIPAYDNLQSSVIGLQSAVQSFVNDPSETNLTDLREALKSARVAWQDAGYFNFGPAEMAALRTSLNTFPADTAKIESNIETGDYLLGSLDNRAAEGFPTIGYLLHGIGQTDTEILDKYTSDSNAASRRTYLLDNADFISDKVATTVNGWAENESNFIGTFLSQENAGTDVGSSLGQLINALVLHYERFVRDGKIGIPAGVRSAGVPRPVATEAFYGEYSAELAAENLKALKRIFLGNNLNNSAGIGLDDNLEALDAGQLSNEITTEIDEAIAALVALNDPLSDQIESNNDPVLQAFNEMQQLTTLLKADMASILGITITFQDNDGD